MTSRYMIEQLRRYEEQTDWEDEDLRHWWAAGGTGSDYMIAHNEGHRLVIEMVHSMIVIQSIGDTLDRDFLKKFIKGRIRECQQYLAQADASIKTESDEGLVYNDDYFKTDGMDCACRTILGILREEVYFPKNKPYYGWSVDLLPRIAGRRLTTDAESKED